MNLFEFEGSHKEIGRAIGRTFGEQIGRTLASNPELQNKFLPYHRTTAGQAQYAQLLALHAQAYPDYVAELRGVAAGAEQPFEQLFIINLRGEYRGYAAEDELMGCSTCSLLTEQAAVLAHNEDGNPIYADALYLVRIHLPHKPTFTALCYPGFLPGNALGFNEHGLCHTVNNVSPTNIQTGKGRHFIARSIFEAQTIDEAIAKVTVSGRAAGFNYTIASTSERRIVDVEVGPNQHHQQEIHGRYFHANHYQELEIPQEIGASSAARISRCQALLNDELQTAADVLAVLQDRGNETLPIFRNAGHTDPLATLATAVFDLDAQTFTLHAGAMAKNQKPLLILALSDKL